MVQETFYKVTVEKHTVGVKEQQEFVRLYESEHPKMKEPNPPEQYGYKSVIKSYVEKSVLLEQKLESIDIERVLKALNKGL